MEHEAPHHLSIARCLLCLLFVGVLSACSGGGDEDDAAAAISPSAILPADRLWEGTASDPLGNELGVRLWIFDEAYAHVEVMPKAFLNPDGSAVLGFITDYFSAGADRCCVLGSSIEVTIIDHKNAISTGTLSATLNGDTIEGSIVRANTTVKFTATQTQATTFAATASTLAGVYSGWHSSYMNSPKGWTLTIETSGRITGADDYGCVWSGNASFSPSNQALAKLDLSAAGCPDGVPLAPANGNYTALAQLFAVPNTHPRYPGQTVLRFSIVGPTWLGTPMLAR